MTRRHRTVLLLIALAVAPNLARAQSRAMVVADQHLAAEVGRDVLAAGGNAVDAAVAVAYALAVVDPCCGNIGGGGFLLVHTASGEDHFIDFRERAPQAATADLFLDPAGRVVPALSTLGWLSVGVPGTVAGLELARERYGTRPRLDLMLPAIRLAEEGFVLGPGDTWLLERARADFSLQPNVAAIFLPNGQPLRPGDRLVQTDLARTLLQIAVFGPDAFYRGPIAAGVVAAAHAQGGILTRADFLRYRAVERVPVTCDYHGLRVITAPPPSGGGTVLCEVLNILAPFDLAAHGARDPETLAPTIEAERQAYADRNAYLGDPDFVANPLARLLSDDYAARARALIPPDRARASAEVSPGLGGLPMASEEGAHTTHFSVLDAAGNAVSVTYTINSFFGAKVIAGDLGFFLNNEMDDFSAKPDTPNQFGLVQGAPNAIGPGKRPLSSMSPTILLRDGHVFMVVGAPGGSRIPTEVLGVIQNVIDHGMTIAQAVAAPRVHHQYLPDVVQLEPGALTPEAATRLRAAGFALRQLDQPWGLAEAILVDPATGAVTGAADPRREGGAAAGLP
jgi:gamma-glutamyltranspeptidase/glutathione hydrolase